VEALKLRIGVSAALPTPVTDGGAVDWARLAAHARAMLGSGMSCVTAFGTTGEGPSVATAMRARLRPEMARAGLAPGLFVEAVWQPAAADAGADVARALGEGAAGILLAPPFFFKGVSDEGLFRWFAEVIGLSGDAARDILLYNIPWLTGVTLSPALVGRLRRAFPAAVAGVKDSGGDWAHTAALLADHRDLCILVGHEGHLARAVRLGASGAISGVANLAPRLLFRLARGEDDAAIEAILAEVLSRPVVPALKALLAAKAGDPHWARCLPPLDTLDLGAEHGRIAALLA
jgi:4-hydroxy-tetrahydrodipicolinate synthase